ncbi:MAG: hypothetical protein HY706_21635, partial [Candidatus Hydrogenedentes bacterium]|nr:hypothetical protein [Candidatus Hydrogenedentota bacterium]
MSPQLLIVADDLTGAADACAPFANRGLVAIVSLQRPDIPPCDVLAVSTESRALTREKSVAQVEMVLQKTLADAGIRAPTLVYKKMDSTLRGHPGAELTAVMQSLGARRALVAPAFPQQGRTTVSGRQQVEGFPIEDTEFGPESGGSDLAAVFDGVSPLPVIPLDLTTVRKGCEPVTQHFQAEPAGIIVADAENEQDLRTLAESALHAKVPVLCGSAGLARALAEIMPCASQAPHPTTRERIEGPVLVIAGSRHRQTQRQVEAAQRANIAVMQVPEIFLGIPQEDPTSSDQAPPLAKLRRTPTLGLISQAKEYLLRRRDLVITATGTPDSPRGAQAVAADLAELAATLLADCTIGGLVLTGGEMASA